MDRLTIVLYTFPTSPGEQICQQTATLLREFHAALCSVNARNLMDVRTSRCIW
jgi:hypothetical protein